MGIQRLYIQRITLELLKVDRFFFDLRRGRVITLKILI